MKIIFLVFITLATSCLTSGEVNRWDCNKFDGAKIISGDGEFLGNLAQDGGQIQFLMILRLMLAPGHKIVFLIQIQISPQNFLSDFLGKQILTSQG